MFEVINKFIQIDFNSDELIESDLSVYRKSETERLIDE